MESVIELKNVTVVYSDKIILDSIHFSLEKGKIYGLVGENGSGKSTLVHCMLGLIPHNKGTVTILNRSIHFAKDRSYVFSVCSAVLQDVSLPKRLTVRECLALFAALGGKEQGNIESIIHSLNLGEQADVAYDSLSFGQKQRVLIGTALLQKFEILFLDEPTNGLDKETREILLGIINSLRDKGKTIVFISHQEEEIANVSDDIIVIKDKKVSIKKGATL